MASTVREWWGAIPLIDQIQRRQASVLQFVLVLWIGLASIGIPLTFLLPASQSATGDAVPPMPAGPLPPLFVAIFAGLSIAGLMLWLTPVIALVLLRYGRFSASVLTATFGLLAAHTVGTYILGITDASVLVVYQIPIAFAGLLGGRRMLLAATGYSLAIVILVGILQVQSPPMAGFFSVMMAAAMGSGAIPVAAIVQPLGFFIAITLLSALLLDRFGFTLRDALLRSLQRETELEHIRTSLESTISERTAELQVALSETQRRSEEQAKLLDEIEQQRGIIRDLSVPVIPVSARTLVLPLVGSLDTARLHYLQEQSLQAIERTSARTVVLDVTGVPIVDSQVALGLLNTVRSSRLLGADTILVGIRPEVAQSMVGIGINLEEVRTFRDLQSALSYTR